MAFSGLPSFYQLGQRISFSVLFGDHTDLLTGEVMDIDAGWIAVKDDASGVTRWFNLDYLISVTVLDVRPTS